MYLCPGIFTYNGNSYTYLVDLYTDVPFCFWGVWVQD